MDDVKVPAEEWDPKGQLESLVFESQMDGGDAAAATARILREHALLAAQSICYLSAYSQNDRIRFEASRFLVEQVLSSGLDADIRLQAEQTKVVGQALFAAIRALGLKYGFDPQSEQVRSVAHDTILALAYDTKEGQEGT